MKIYLLLLCTLFSLQSLGSDDVPPDVVTASLTSISIKGDDYLAVSLKNAPKWHTYWINPGDAGLPLKVEFTVGDKILPLDPVEWPLPKKLMEDGDVHVFGLEGEYSLFYKIPSATLNNQTVSSKVTWLVCKHICIPGQVEIKGKYRNKELTLDAAPAFTIAPNQLIKRFYDLPKKAKWPSELTLSLVKKSDDDALILHYEIGTERSDKIFSDQNILTPYPQEPFDFRHENLFQGDKKIVGQTVIEWDGEYQSPQLPLPKNGYFAKPYLLKFLYLDLSNGTISVIEKKFEQFLLTPAPSTATLIPLRQGPKSGSKIEMIDDDKILGKEEVDNDLKNLNTFGYYLLLAFLGGLILNIMPCVLPVISLKLFGLIRHQNAPRKVILRHNLFYTFGVLFSFISLATIIILFKKAGESVGWGFQLQSPIFVGMMIVFLMLFSLNLFGLFEISTPGGRYLGNLRLEENAWGDFLSGVMATILSTPCSAPFLGTALTFAFTSPTSIIYSVFIFIGLGLSFPFLLTALFPKFLNIIPQPGPWMDKVKRFLGLSLLLTAVWLIDLFSALVPSTNEVSRLLLGLLLLYFAFYYRAYISKNRLWNALLFIIPILLFIQLGFQLKNQSNAPHQPNAIVGKELPWERWSVTKLEEMRAQNELVFIDFTAKWCLTCKVNEQLVLETSAFKALVEKYRLKLLLGDWTKNDPAITDWLAEHGKVGVPAYYILNKDGKLISLGETISIDKIEKYLK